MDLAFDSSYIKVDIMFIVFFSFDARLESSPSISSAKLILGKDGSSSIGSSFKPSVPPFAISKIRSLMTERKPRMSFSSFSTSLKFLNGGFGFLLPPIKIWVWVGYEGSFLQGSKLSSLSSS